MGDTRIARAIAILAVFSIGMGANLDFRATPYILRNRGSPCRSASR